MTFQNCETQKPTNKHLVVKLPGCPGSSATFKRESANCPPSRQKLTTKEEKNLQKLVIFWR